MFLANAKFFSSSNYVRFIYGIVRLILTEVRYGGGGEIVINLLVRISMLKIDI